jgi:phosphoglycolate phosphatase/putative hydrolase of the HAD superfamily
MISLDWQGIDLVVFDVDGTLYDQRRLRFKMVQQLIAHCLRHPGDLRTLRVISTFRRCREELAEKESESIADLQFLRPAEELGVEPDAVRRTVEDWLLQRPLEHLRSCRYAKVAEFMAVLRANGKQVAVLSDYPAGDKLRALELEASLAVSAVDPEVDRLKPHPKGLHRVVELAGVVPGRALLVGDRDDRDGECARRAGISYLIRSRAPATDGHQFQDYGELVRSLHPGRAEEAALQ